MGKLFKTSLRSSNQLFLTHAVLTFFILGFFINVVNSAKILIFIGLSSHSHRVAIQPLADKLSEIGHEVTFLSPIKPEVKNPKIKEFCPQALQDLNEKFDKEFGGESVIKRLKNRYYNPFFTGFGGFSWGLSYDFHAATVCSPDFKEWAENATFDLVITEHPCKEIAHGLAYKFGAKVIGFSASSVSAMDADMFGWPTEASWLPRIDSLLKDVFQDDTIPPTETLIKNMTLYLVNVHHSSEFARSLPPFVIPIGGIHVEQLKKALPKSIEDFIGAGENEGFIYISFGSIIKVSALPENIQKDFFDAIASFKKVKFLLKWEGEFPKDLQSNVLPMKWFPQQDVLAHPKCRGFVSQGGLMSFQQAVHHAVPMIIVPVFGDQPFNAEAAVHQGNGIHLELADITFESFSHALWQLLYNPAYLIKSFFVLHFRYSAKAKEVARRFRDRPMSAVDTAVWWTEYVLRHNVTSHLKPLGINQEWWQRRLLDFWAIVFTGVLLIVFVTLCLLRSLMRLCKKSESRSQKKIKKS